METEALRTVHAVKDEQTRGQCLGVVLVLGTAVSAAVACRRFISSIPAATASVVRSSEIHALMHYILAAQIAHDLTAGHAA